MRIILIILFFSGMHSVLIAQFKEGFIIDNYDRKYPGFLNFVQDELFFKETKTGKREKLTPEKLKAFVIENDSFITVRNFKLTPSRVFNGFAKVRIENSGRLLFSISRYTTTKSTAVIATVEATHYFIQTEGKRYEVTKSNFMKEMPVLVGDNAALKQKISAKEFGFNDMEKIISFYNQESK